MPKNPKQKKIVVIGGGTGVFTVLSGLREYPFRLSAVVSMADDGGSTGVLREEFGVLPPGDIRRALVALAGHGDKEILSALFNYRFEKGYGLEGHNFGNLFLAALERLTGDFSAAVGEVSRLLGVQGEVIPVTLEQTTLWAKLEDGTFVKGETNIDIPKHDGRLRISRVFLKPKPRPNPAALRAIRDADAIVIGPGDLYTSIVPNLLVSGIAAAIRRSSAKKIYVGNIMTKFGETYGFGAAEFLRVIEAYLGMGVLDYFVLNGERPNRERLKPYIRERAEPVRVDDGDLPSGGPAVVKARLLRKGRLIRHDPQKLAHTLALLV